MSKRAKKTLTDKERSAVWVIHHGPHTKDAICPLCGERTMTFKEKGTWEAGHIVAEHFSVNPYSPFYMLPCCAACNKETGTKCIIDVLWDRFRVDTLMEVCTNIFKVYAQKNADVMKQFDFCMWRVVEYLYGSETHPAGGGVSVMNEAPIYRLLMLHQLHSLEREIATLMSRVSEKTQLMETLLKDSYDPRRGLKRPFG